VFHGRHLGPDLLAEAAIAVRACREVGVVSLRGVNRGAELQVLPPVLAGDFHVGETQGRGCCRLAGLADPLAFLDVSTMRVNSG